MLLPAVPARRKSWRNFLGRHLRFTLVISLALLLAPHGWAQAHPQVSLETSETLFTVLTAMNTCGYDHELETSDPLRAQIRAEVAKSVADTEGADKIVARMCEFYKQRRVGDPAHDLSQYVSLALYLGEPPAFTPKLKDEELPPDAAVVVDIVPLMKAFYEKIGLHAIWVRHRAQYQQMIAIYHEPLSKMVFDTEIYLKLPSAGYLGRQFTIYVDAMAAPSQTNARNYGADYYVVFSPSSGTAMKMQQIRHAYLHYVLDPLAMKNNGSINKLQPILASVQGAPMDDAFRSNISLLVTECMVRAIELRTDPSKNEEQRTKALDEDDHDGYVLTRDFYGELGMFEKDPAGLRNAYPGMLGGIDVGREAKRAKRIEYATEAVPELVRQSRQKSEHLLMHAERELSEGNAKLAEQLAKQALEEQEDDPGKAFFVLAQVESMRGNMEGATDFFHKALNTAHEPKVLAWSHIYLGRIFDLKEERESALNEYRAALTAAGTEIPEEKVAAERGLGAPYEPQIPKRPE
ncbi:MAG: tetratricopeptide repeat protein [Terriglobales bacterium]